MTRRTPTAVVEPLGVAVDRGIGCVKLARHGVSRARPGVHRTSEPSSNVTVGEEAAFDGPYNTALHPTRVGPLARAPRPLARWYRDSLGAGERPR